MLSWPKNEFVVVVIIVVVIVVAVVLIQKLLNLLLLWVYFLHTMFYIVCQQLTVIFPKRSCV